MWLFATSTAPNGSETKLVTMWSRYLSSGGPKQSWKDWHSSGGQRRDWINVATYLSHHCMSRHFPFIKRPLFPGQSSGTKIKDVQLKKMSSLMAARICACLSTGACRRVPQSARVCARPNTTVGWRRKLICLSIYSASLCSTMQQQPLDKEASLWDSNEGERRGAVHRKDEGVGGGVWRLSLEGWLSCTRRGGVGVVIDDEG